MAFTDISKFKVFTWVCMVSFTRVQGEIGNNSKASDLIASFIGNILSPLVNNADQDPPIDARRSASGKYNPIIALIESKVESLTPYLQDTDKSDETTIIEFYPRRNNLKGVEYATFENIHNYKKIRDVIKINLDNESVSNKTKKIVIKTIDALINQLNKSKCTQRNGEDSVITLRNGDVSDPKNLTISMKDWKNITNLFFNNLKTRMTTKPEKLHTKADEINDFFINILNNTINTNTKQRMKCELVDIPKERAREDENTDTCPNFKICSGELKKYLRNYYKDCSETVESTFKNYAAMFIRDANDDESEKALVERVIVKMAETNKARVDKVFEKHVAKLNLGINKEKNNNTGFIDEFLKGVKSHIIKYIKKHIDTDLMQLRTRILLNVKDDLLSNLDQDLQQLENKYITKKCKDFNICNGEASTMEKRTRNDNGVYVNLKLTMDDELRDSILKPNAILKKFIYRRDGRRYLNKIENITYKGVHRVTRTTFPDIKIKNITIKESADGNVLVVETS